MKIYRFLKKFPRNRYLVIIVAFLFVYVLVYIGAWLVQKNKNRSPDRVTNSAFRYELLQKPEADMYVGRLRSNIIFLDEHKTSLIIHSPQQEQKIPLRHPIGSNAELGIFCGALIELNFNEIYDFSHKRLNLGCSEKTSMDVYLMENYLIVGCLNSDIKSENDWAYKIKVYTGENCHVRKLDDLKKAVDLKLVHTQTFPESVAPFTVKGDYIYFSSISPFSAGESVYILNIKTKQLKSLNSIRFVQYGTNFAMKKDTIGLLNGVEFKPVAHLNAIYDCYLGIFDKALYAKKHERNWQVLYGSVDQAFLELLNMYVNNCDLIKRVYYGTNVIDIELNNDMILNIEN